MVSHACHDQSLAISHAAGWSHLIYGTHLTMDVGYSHDEDAGTAAHEVGFPGSLSEAALTSVELSTSCLLHAALDSRE